MSAGGARNSGPRLRHTVHSGEVAIVTQTHVVAESSDDHWRSRASTWHSALISIVCHLMALIALGLLTVAVQEKSSGVALLTEMIGAADSLTSAELSTVSVASSAAGAATGVGPETLFDTDAFAAANVNGPSVELEIAPHSSGLSGMGAGTGGEGKGLSGAGLGADFFGLGGQGTSFVYVLDCSDSMNNEDRFRRAREELIYSIERLSAEQRFYVILYSDGAIPMDADDPVPAVPKEFARLRTWLERAEPFGGTYPWPALEYAISLEPDAIYFLSDGEFEPNIISAVREKNKKSNLNPRQIPIHAIAFASQAGENQMKILARTSGGKYRFVK